MFTETITHAGAPTTGTATESHASYLLRRALRRGFDVEATPGGGARIDWTALSLTGDGAPVRAPRSITLSPQTPAGTLTDTVRADLAAIADTPAARHDTDRGARVIVGGLWRIPPGATARLHARGLVIEEQGRPRLSLAAQLALLAHAHRTTTTQPEGWHRSTDPYGSAGLNRPGRRAGLMHDRTSAAVCSCGELSAWGGDQEEARRLATAHRRAAAAVFIVAELGAPTP
ncbi:hypothetical protein OG234_13360 [Streptomyces sp. NBC_01420]|uniref:hypothetical protein n=1 Tax=Streptomyces sp. NBC_01420 TaxID=2903858 RepID=UPI003247DDD2